MIVDFMNELESLGLFEDVQITFDGGFSVSSYNLVVFAFFILTLFNIWVALKFFLKKVI